MTTITITDTPCLARNRDYICTQDRGHDGRHVARDDDAGSPLVVWGASGAPHRRGCPAWCTDHYNDGADTSYHTTGYHPLAGAVINMTTGTIENDTRIFGLYELGTGKGGDAITVDEAEQVAFLLLGFVAAARSTEVGR